MPVSKLGAGSYAPNSSVLLACRSAAPTPTMHPGAWTQAQLLIVQSLEHLISALQQENADLQHTIAHGSKWPLERLIARRELQSQYITILQEFMEELRTAALIASYGGSPTNTGPQCNLPTALLFHEQQQQQQQQASGFWPGHTGSPASSATPASPAAAAAASAHTPPPVSPHQQQETPTSASATSSCSAALGSPLAIDGGEWQNCVPAAAAAAAVAAASVQPYDYALTGQHLFSAMFDDGAGPDVVMDLLLQGCQLYGSPSAAVHVGQVAGGAGLDVDQELELMDSMAAGDAPLAAGQPPSGALNQGSPLGPGAAPPPAAKYDGGYAGSMDMDLDDLELQLHTPLAAGQGSPLGPSAGQGLLLAAAAKGAATAAAAEGGYEGGVGMDLDLPDLDWDQLDDLDLAELAPKPADLDIAVGAVVSPPAPSVQLQQQGGTGEVLFPGLDDGNELLDELHREVRGDDFDTWLYGLLASVGEESVVG